MTHISRLNWTLSLALAILAGCKAAPAPSAGFADPAILKTDPNSPFDEYWREPDADWNGYTRIYIADINTSYMLKMTDWQKGERVGDIQRDVQKIATYMRQNLIIKFRDDPRHRFKVVDSPTHDPHTIVLEIALTQMVPSKVLLNAAEYAPFFVGTGITIVRAIANDRSTAAFEARVRDADTGKIVALAADCEAQQFAIIDVRSLTWYSDIDGIIDDWSNQFVQVFNAKTDEKIASASTFRLSPW